MAAHADTGLGFVSGKWTGFHFGVGMGHEWPAIRVSNIPGVQYMSAKRADVSGSAERSATKT